METRSLLKRLGLVLVLAAVAAAVLAACGSSSSSSSTPAASASAKGGGGTATVSIKNIAFTPQKLEVAVGTTVTWTNQDSVPHDVTSTSSNDIDAATNGTFASGTMQPGDTFSFTFTKAGGYFYECTIHKTIPAMHAEIVVK